MTEEQQKSIDNLKKQIETMSAELSKLESIKPEEIKPLLRWRAPTYGAYWLINEFGVVVNEQDRRTEYDNWHYIVGNYFQTEKKL